jgi:hypothetical protein
VPHDQRALYFNEAGFSRVDCTELIDSYLNGPRTLSNERLSYLIVSEPGVATHAGLLTPPPTPMLDMTGPPVLNGDRQYEVLICAAHFIGDGECRTLNPKYGSIGADWWVL